MVLLFGAPELSLALRAMAGVACGLGLLEARACRHFQFVFGSGAAVGRLCHPPGHAAVTCMDGRRVEGAGFTPHSAGSRHVCAYDRSVVVGLLSGCIQVH